MHICIIFNISYLVDVHGDMPKHEERSSEFQTKTPTPKNGDTSKVADKNRDSNLLNRVQESHRGIKSSTALGPYRRIRNGAQETQEQLNPSKTQSPAALVQEMITFFSFRRHNPGHHRPICSVRRTSRCRTTCPLLKSHERGETFLASCLLRHTHGYNHRAEG